MSPTPATLAEHTPTPWHLRDEGSPFVAIQGTPAEGATYGDMVTINSGGFAQPRGRGAANAAFIVRAVNLHDELVRALSEVVGALRIDQSIIRNPAYESDDAAWLLERIDALLVKAGA